MLRWLRTHKISMRAICSVCKSNVLPYLYFESNEANTHLNKKINSKLKYSVQIDHMVWSQSY